MTMRLCSDDESDPGFEPWQRALLNGYVAHVYLDGVPVKLASMADEQTGEVRRPVLNDKGWVQISPDNPEEFWIETVTGNVKIELKARN